MNEAIKTTAGPAAARNRVSALAQYLMDTDAEAAILAPTEVVSIASLTETRRRTIETLELGQH